MLGEAGAVQCPMCKGMGSIGDSGPAPPSQPGFCGFRAGTDCARDWAGLLSEPDVRAARLELWKGPGLEPRAMDFSDAAPLLTRHAHCSDACKILPADRRATPREGSPPVDVTDLPPGGAPASAPTTPRLKVTDVQIHHTPEDERGSIAFVVLTFDLSDGTHRECEIAVPPEWTEVAP